MKDTQEIWKDIPEFEGRYQVSNLGRIKSLARVDRMNRNVPEIILKPSIKNQYHVVNLYKPFKNRKKNYPRYVHRLVFHAFNGIKPDHIDHLNEVKTDNNLSNLEAVTPRENVHRYIKSRPRDLPLGVHFLKAGQRKKRFRALIMINGKQFPLGNHLTPEEASNAYQNKLRTLIL